MEARRAVGGGAQVSDRCAGGTHLDVGTGHGQAGAPCHRDDDAAGGVEVAQGDAERLDASEVRQVLVERRVVVHAAGRQLAGGHRRRDRVATGCADDLRRVRRRGVRLSGQVGSTGTGVALPGRLTSDPTSILVASGGAGGGLLGGSVVAAGGEQETDESSTGDDA